MGASISTNSVDSMIENSIKVINAYEQSCIAPATEQDITFNADDCTFNGQPIKLQNGSVINQSCILNATTQSAITSSVTQAMQQISNSMVQQFSFGTVASANNFIKSAIKLGEEISNTYLSKCVVDTTKQSITFNCKNSDISGLVDFSNFSSTTQNCILTADTINAARQELISQFSQSATATQQSTFLYILLALGLFLGIGAWFLVSVADNPLIQWGIVGLVLFTVVSSIIYAATAKNSGNYPYTKP